MRKTDVLKTLFVCICVCHVCPAKPCGENPMDYVASFSRNRGMEGKAMLDFIKLNAPSDYSTLMGEYGRYLDCTRMLHSSYFKRSVDSVQTQKLPSPFLETKQSLKERLNSLLSEGVSDDNVNALLDSLPKYRINTSVRSGLRETQQTQPNKMSINGTLAGLKVYTSLLERLLKSHMTDAPRTAIQDGGLDTNIYSNIRSRLR